MADKIFSFEELNKEMSKFSELGDILETSSVSVVDHYIHSGNYHLNACLTGSLRKGYPNNRAVALAGPKGSGKTFLLLNAAREAQKMGYYIVFYDSENAVDKDQAIKFGIDPNKFRYEPVGTVQEFRTQVTQLTEILIAAKKAKKEIPQIMIMLDSAGNLATQKEIDDALSGSEKADMTRAKVLKSIFRIIINRLALIKAPFIFTNHIYLSQSFIPQTIQGGGCLDPESEVLMYNMSYKKIKDIREDDLVHTLFADKKVLKTWEFEKSRYEVEFEDGSKLICSEDHRFYVGNKDDDPLDDKNWIYAKNLMEGNEVSKYS